MLHLQRLVQMEMRHRQTGDVQPAVASDAHEQPQFATSQLAQNLGSLAQLHKDGSLTDDEFARAKATALATDEKGAVAGGPQIAVHLSAAGSKLAGHHSNTRALTHHLLLRA